MKTYSFVNKRMRFFLYFQGNVTIVEIPSGEHLGDVANKILLYLRNALAFVFVLDVTNANRSNDEKVS